MPSPRRRLTRAGVAGAESASALSGERERGVPDREGVDGYDERSVTVAVSLLVWRVCARVFEPAVDGREDGGLLVGKG